MWRLSRSISKSWFFSKIERNRYCDFWSKCDSILIDRLLAQEVTEWFLYPCEPDHAECRGVYISAHSITLTAKEFISLTPNIWAKKIEIKIELFIKNRIEIESREKTHNRHITNIITYRVLRSWSRIFFSISASVSVSRNGHHWSASDWPRMATSTTGSGASLHKQQTLFASVHSALLLQQYRK